MTTYHLLPEQTGIRHAISEYYRKDEQDIVQQLIESARVDELAPQIKDLAVKLVEKVRKRRKNAGGVDALMHEFSLSSQEGVALMCLAEALLRIPDQATRDKLIQDKIAKGDWKSHTGKSPSLFVNAAAWGLVLTGKLVKQDEKSLSSTLSKLIAKGGEPLIRQSMNIAMQVLGKQFVTGKNIQDALKNSEKRFAKGFRYTYDMLGESALTEEDAKRYFQDYVNAIHAVGQASIGRGVRDGSGVSVKLSAIHPRYSMAQHQRVMEELYPRLKELFLLAKKYDIGLNIDAEEAARLEISIDLFDRLIADPDLAGFDGIGFVVQAYQKRCPKVIEYVIGQARNYQRKVMIRLVKGAYWDSEIKLAQAEGAEGYPLYTRKVHTDLSYITCAKILLAADDAVYPQFATHNAQTLSTIYHLAQGKAFEFQCLHGMGETLYDEVVGKDNLNVQCRVYAPVGSYETLLAYLVRRLLENGANSSFLNQIVDESIPLERLAQDPVQKALETQGTAHPNVPLPIAILGERQNSKGYDLSDAVHLRDLENAMNECAAHQYHAAPLLGDESPSQGALNAVFNPAEQDQQVGSVVFATEADVQKAFDIAAQNQKPWQNTPPVERAACLERMADLMEANMPTLFDLAVREAGKTLNNAIAEVREAVDFCRYYAAEVRSNPQEFSDPRGIVVAISPWNFPLAIFTGEVSAALAAGNVVLAKPAGQTALIAHYAVQLFHQAGVPKGVLQFLSGSGSVVGNALIQDPRVNGVIFTGSTETAKGINQHLQNREDIVPIIAETGGQNAMVVDSSALAEQVVIDVINSAFDSAGQRCSALRVLYVQEDVAERLIGMIKGAMAELKVGRPQYFNTDVGPVIDRKAQAGLLAHIEAMKKQAKFCYQTPIDAEIEQNGIFVPPTFFEIDSIRQLKHEVFGPVLHLIRFKAGELDRVFDEINSTGFGLTSGIHSRIDATVNKWLEAIHAGNLYVNRNTVGAVVGVQPFGGMGLSGTGPKAGGPLYLQRLVNRRAWALEGLEQKTFAKPTALSDLQRGLKALLSGEALNQALKLIEELGNQSPLGKVMPLQGITGESNTLGFASRPFIAIGKGDLASQLKALIAIQACGAKALVEKDSLLAQYAEQFKGYLEVVDDFNGHDALSLLIVLDPLSLEQKRHYAQRQGAILTFVENLDLALSLFPLVHEKSVSINTAAAGGNATLMAEMD